MESCIPIDYAGLMKLRADFDEEIHAGKRDANGTEWILGVKIKGVERQTSLLESDADFVDFNTRVIAKERHNRKVWKKEKAFESPDFVDRTTWHGKSVGDHVAWFVGGVVRDPQDPRTWLSAAAIPYLTTFATDYAAGNLNAAFTALAQARAHKIAPSYDNYNYVWKDANGNRLAYYDATSFVAYGGVWRDDAGNPIARYDFRVNLPATASATPNTGASALAMSNAFHVDGNGVAVEPTPGTYDLTVAAGSTSGYKFTWGTAVADNVAWSQGGVVTLDDAVQGALAVTMGAAAPGALPATDPIVVTTAANPTHDLWIKQDAQGVWNTTLASLGIETSRFRVDPYDPTGTYKLATHQTLMRAQEGVAFNGGVLTFEGYGYADTTSTPVAAPFPGIFQGDKWTFADRSQIRARANDRIPAGADGIETFINDYSKTQPLVVDVLQQQYADVYVAGDVKMSGSTIAQATFICMKIDSF